jgi:hypothetical protein
MAGLGRENTLSKLLKISAVLCVGKNGYGLCSGSSGGKADEAGVLPLTDWLPA